MEAKGKSEITSAADVLRRVQLAMERFGIEFTNDDRPGVRLDPTAIAKAVVKSPARKSAAAKPPRTKGK
jgi:hypothetical protein